MAKVIRREVRQRGFFGWVFLTVFFGFNILMAWWLIAYWGEVGQSLVTGSEAQRSGAAIGSTVGTGVILLIWALGAVITGLLAILTRGSVQIIEETTPSGGTAAVSDREFPESYNGLNYRRERDGSVIVSTAAGPQRYANWKDFWAAINSPRP